MTAAMGKGDFEGVVVESLDLGAAAVAAAAAAAVVVVVVVVVVSPNHV